MSFELQDLRRILRDGAGADEDVDLDGEILDTAFDDLGYDSLALLELISQIRRQYGVDIPDDAPTDLMPTPDAAVSYVNRALGTMVGV